MPRNKTNLAAVTDAAPLLRYEEAKRAVELFINNNGLKPGDRIPTEAELRAQFGWSRVTINRALNELVGKGILRRVQGSGTYVAEVQRQERSLRIMVCSHEYKEQDDYCSPLFAGIREEAGAQQKVDIVYHSDLPVPSVETVLRNQVDGVLSISWSLDDLTPILMLNQSDVAVVSIALHSRVIPLPSVYSDNYGGILNAVEYLLGKGHRRIAFISKRVEDSDVSERLLGFHAAHARNGIPLDPALLLLGNETMEELLIENWWAYLNPLPSAVLVHSSTVPQMLAMLQKKGVSLPNDLSLICIDDISIARLVVPPLTVLSQSAYQLGRRGLAKLTRMLRCEDDGRPEMLPTELIERGSVTSLVHIEADSSLQSYR